MARLWGGATGPYYDPPPPRLLDEDYPGDLVRASREIDAQRHPDPARPRSRWERVRIEGEWVEVEVERLEAPSDDEGGLVDGDGIVAALIGESPEEEADREAATFRRELREARAPFDPPSPGAGEARGLASFLPSHAQEAFS